MHDLYDDGDRTDDKSLMTLRRFLRWEARHNKEYEDARAKMNEKLDTIIDLIKGDGTEDNPGILLRLDRIERDKKSAERIRNWLLGGALGSIGAWLGNRFSGS